MKYGTRMVGLFLGLALVPSLTAQTPVKDRHGVPLPPNAVARLGSSAFRHDREIIAFAFSPDSKKLAILAPPVTDDYGVAIWDIPSRTKQASFVVKGTQWLLNEIRFSPDGTMLALVANDNQRRPGTPKETQLWDWSAGKQVDGLPKGKLRAAAFSKDRDVIAFQPDDANRLVVWNLRQQKEIHRVEPLTATLTQLLFDSSDSLLAAFDDGQVRTWDMETGKERPQKKNPDHADFSSDGRWYTVNQHEKGWGVAETETGKRVVEAKGNIADMKFGDDNRTVAWRKDHEIHLWDLANAKEKARLPIIEHSQPKIRVSSDGKWLGVCYAQQVRLYDLTRPATERELGWNDHTVGSLAFSPDGKMLAGSSWNGYVSLWNVAEARSLRLPKRYSDRAVRFTSDGKELLIGVESQTVYAEDCATFKVRHEPKPRFERDPNRFHPIAEPPDLNALGRDFGWPKVRSKLTVKTVVGDKKQTVTIDGHFAVSSADGKTLLSAHGVVGPDIMSSAPPINPVGPWMVWDAVTGRKRFELIDRTREAPKRTDAELRLEQFLGRRGDFGPVYAACSPTGRHIAWHNDKRLVVSDLYSGATLASVESPSAVAAFSPDGKSVACVDADKRIKILEVVTGKPRLILEGHTELIASVVYSPKGAVLASSSHDGTIVLWDVIGTQRPKRKDRLNDDDLQEAWMTFAGTDVAKAHSAAIDLSQHPQQAIPWLKDRIEADAKSLKRDVDPLVKALNSDQYPVRLQAEKKLRQYGALVIPSLQSALQNPPSLEYRRRLENLMLELSGVATGGHWVQMHRGLELLERLRASEVLEALSRDDGPIGLEARTCRDRLRKK